MTERGSFPSSMSAPETRRGFIRKSALLAASTAIGAHIPFGRFLPANLIPVALAQSPELKLLGKNAALIVLGDKPFVAETPAHLLDDDVTPESVMFVRNNGLAPARESIDPARWTLAIDGESARNPGRFTLAELKQRFRPVTLHLALECAGNGRSEFFPPAKGNQWTYGGVGFPEWTGVRLRDVLQAVGIKDDAVYIGYYGADTHLSGDASTPVISRGVPLAKALEPESLLAWSMNGQDLPWVHGYPLRLVLSGYPGSVSGKWLTRIAVRNRVHDGAKMSGHDYRQPCEPLPPGENSNNYCIMEGLPVKSLITFPQSGVTHELAKPFVVRGQAWTNTERIERVDLSIDFGQTWIATDLKPARNRYAPHRWVAGVRLPKRGYYEVWARATDNTGRAQPMVVPGWNTGGYGNNAAHRIAVRAV
jgi:DMSO/TMAO reductase YedYZ molybdopterin-dependent catalytic subunit